MEPYGTVTILGRKSYGMIADESDEAAYGGVI